MDIDTTLSWQAENDVSAPPGRTQAAAWMTMQETTASYSLPDSCNASAENQQPRRRNGEGMPSGALLLSHVPRSAAAPNRAPRASMPQNPPTIRVSHPGKACQCPHIGSASCHAASGNLAYLSGDQHILGWIPAAQLVMHVRHGTPDVRMCVIPLQRMPCSGSHLISQTMYFIRPLQGSIVKTPMFGETTPCPIYVPEVLSFMCVEVLHCTCGNHLWDICMQPMQG